jgi:hypothetical protein
VLGYTRRTTDGKWIGCDPLSPSERAARELRSQRTALALRHPTRITNPNAMREALADAFAGRPTIGALRRGLHEISEVDPFDWEAVRGRAGAEHASEVQRVLSPRRSSVVPGGRQRGRARSRSTKPRSYGLAALDSECWRVADTPPGNRNNVLASSAFKIGQIVGAGLLDHAEPAANLLGAALDAGLPESEARGVIRSGLRKGARRPRSAG